MPTNIDEATVLQGMQVKCSRKRVYLFDHHEHYRIYFSNKSYLPFFTKFTEMEKPVILMNVKWIIWINDSKLIIIFVILEIYM